MNIACTEPWIPGRHKASIVEQAGPKASLAGQGLGKRIASEAHLGYTDPVSEVSQIARLSCKGLSSKQFRRQRQESISLVPAWAV